nr:phage holin family protein [Plesiomonas shigelloides]
MNDILVSVNAVICALIAVRLLLFNRTGCRHKPWLSILAYVITVAAAAITIIALLGVGRPVDTPQVVLNAVLLLFVFMARGNVARLVNGKRI